MPAAATDGIAYLIHLSTPGSDWYYTTADVDVTYTGSTYPVIKGATFSAEPLSDITKVSASQARGDLEIDMPSDNPAAMIYYAVPPDRSIDVVIYQCDLQDVDITTAKWWTGLVRSCATVGDETKFTCETRYSRAKRQATAGREFRRECSWQLFGAGCGLDKTAFKDAATIAELAVSGDALKVKVEMAAQRVADYFAAGLVDAGERSQRIESSTSGTASGSGTYYHTLTLALPLPGVAVDDAVDVYPGCDKSTSTCDNKFSNITRFGGFPFIGSKNPFTDGAR